jgi:hypothetical protein
MSCAKRRPSTANINTGVGNSLDPLSPRHKPERSRLTVMRQRVLLVAGWAAAAVVTSLVASGAVAVAGGQVADRPLRPLSAAEVAELPVVLTEGGQVPCRPLASGGSDRNTAAPGDNDGDGPAGDEASSAASGDEVPAVQTRVVSVRGGTASVASEDGTVRLLWAIARPGFTVRQASEDDGGLTVSFWCGDLESVVVANHDESGLHIDVLEDAR